VVRYANAVRLKPTPLSTFSELLHKARLGENLEQQGCRRYQRLRLASRCGRVGSGKGRADAT
ncbi:MAG: hypothetical protein ACN6OP_28030, partial [Pseudomonadales bacterium]